MNETASGRLETLGLKLPVPSATVGAYLPLTRSGNLVFVSGQLSIGPDGLVAGKLGTDLDVEGGQRAAAFCALNVLGQLVHAGNASLDSISRVLKLTVLVASAPDFHEHHLVANGASDLLVAVLGERGKHARAAFGVAALPLGAAVEMDAIIEVNG